MYTTGTNYYIKKVFKPARSESFGGCAVCDGEITQDVFFEVSCFKDYRLDKLCPTCCDRLFGESGPDFIDGIKECKVSVSVVNESDGTTNRTGV
jgi:hypothetical protein